MDVSSKEEMIRYSGRFMVTNFSILLKEESQVIEVYYAGNTIYRREFPLDVSHEEIISKTRQEFGA